MKIIVQIVVLTFIFFSETSLNAQSDFKKTKFKITKTNTKSPKDIAPDFNPTLNNLEAPIPEGNTSNSYLLQQKIASKEYFKHKLKTNSKTIEKSSDGPIIGLTFEPKRYTISGTQLPIYGGLPSDNTMAISNDGIIITAMKS